MPASPNYYTTVDRDDGFGAQIQNIIIDLLVTENRGDKYVFPDIKAIAHNYDDNASFVLSIISYINLKGHYILPENTTLIKYNGIELYREFENNINYYLKTESYNTLRDVFFSNKQTPYNSEYFNIAVHVRRPNIHDNRLEGADTPDSYYLNIINTLRSTYTDKPLKFHIYSQGKPEDFGAYLNDDTFLHINDSVTDTFTGLLFGDVLVTSASSFSYAAALLTRGIVYYKRFWHAPASNWIINS